jgi:PKD repeat protein
VTGRTDPAKYCQETFASGLRNPFRFAFDPNANATRSFVDDVGQDAWEEIDEGVAGADYGWNVREGFCARAAVTGCRTVPGVVGGLTDPIHAYGHDVGYAVTGGAFVPAGAWPAGYDGDYLFGDFGGTIMRLHPDGSGGWTRSDFVTGLGNASVVALAFGPHDGAQALYYTTLGGGCIGCGRLHRVDPTGAANRVPVADVAATPTSGLAPLVVGFDGGGSSDPDGDPLTYRWDFGDGTPVEQTGTATAGHSYPADGVYQATLVVLDGDGAASPAARTRIDVGNTPPAVTIGAPLLGTRFRVGQPVSLAGSATDTQDGALPGSRLSWRVVQHHATHTHPYLPPTPGVGTVTTMPAPEDLQAAGNSYLTVQLTATDSGGLTTTVSQDLLPRVVDVTLATAPRGLRVAVNGAVVTGPRTLTSWQGYRLDVGAPPQVAPSGQSFVFRSWSDGGAGRHRVTTPATTARYTATFRPTSGLRAVYYGTSNFTGPPRTRVDPRVDFGWGRLLVDHWTAHRATRDRGRITLVAGHRYPIRMDYYDRRGDAVARLWWSAPSRPTQIVPSDRLAP